jgi:hypothetical protein
MTTDDYFVCLGIILIVAVVVVGTRIVNIVDRLRITSREVIKTVLLQLVQKRSDSNTLYQLQPLDHLYILRGHFVNRGDEEGVMLMDAVGKRLTIKRKRRKKVEVKDEVG